MQGVKLYALIFTVMLFGSVIGYGLTNYAVIQPLEIKNTYLEGRIDSLNNITYPSVFEICKDGEYTCVNITSVDVTVFKSLSSSEAVQWALDNVVDHTHVDITEDIDMDGWITYPGNKSYGVIVAGGHLIFNISSFNQEKRS